MNVAIRGHDGALIPDVIVRAAPPDEPPLYLAEASLKCGGCQRPAIGVAASLDDADAATRARGECWERWALCERSHRADQVEATFESFEVSALAPMDFVGVPDAGFAVRVSPSSMRSWSHARRLTDDSTLLVPTETIRLRHNTRRESELREPTTSGAAYAANETAATVRAAAELVERDAFMQALSGATRPFPLDPDAFASLQPYRLDRFRLTVKLFALPTVVGTHAVLAIMLDPSRVGPAVTTGLSLADSFDMAAEHAVREAWQPRIWLRSLRPWPPTGESDIVDVRTRALYWADTSRLDKLGPLLCMPTPAGQPRMGGHTDNLLERLRLAGVDLYSDNSDQKVGDGAVVRLMSPQLLPLFLSEQYSSLSTPAVLPLPHFFL